MQWGHIHVEIYVATIVDANVIEGTVSALEQGKM